MDAETKRYIDQQLFKLRKDILHAISTSVSGKESNVKKDTKVKKDSTAK